MALNGIICNTGLLGGQWYLEKFDPTFDLQKEYLFNHLLFWECF